MKLKIKELRQERHLSPIELSKLAGISRANLSELENPLNPHKNPTIKTMCRLAKALGVNIDDLVDCEED